VQPLAPACLTAVRPVLTWRARARRGDPRLPARQSPARRLQIGAFTGDL